MLVAAGGGDDGLRRDVAVGGQALLLLLVDLDLADAGPEGTGSAVLHGVGKGHIEVGGGHGLGQGEPGLHAAGEGDGLRAEGDQIAGDAVLGILNGDVDGPRRHIVAAQLDDHLGNAAAHVQLDHGGGGPYAPGLPVGGRITIDDIADDVAAIFAVLCGGGAEKGDVDQLLCGPCRQHRCRRGEQACDGTQHQNDAQYALFHFLHS